MHQVTNLIYTTVLLRPIELVPLHLPFVLHRATPQTRANAHEDGDLHSFLVTELVRVVIEAAIILNRITHLERIHLLVLD